MKVFNYLSSGKGIQETYEIYKAVRALKNYAMSIYGSGWEDALDASFFHILEKYDPSKGDLENYTIRVVKTIRLNKNKKEVADDDQTMIGLDLKSAKEYDKNEIDLVFEDNISDDMTYCLRDMLSLFLKDYKFFVSQNIKDRKMDYSGLFKKYSVEVIGETKRYLTSKYKEEVEKFVEFAKNSNIRKFNAQRYEKSIDGSAEYVNEINGIVILKRKRSSHSRSLYKVPLRDVINNLLELYYGCDECGVLCIEGITAYLTLSGNVVDSIEDLKDELELELIGSLLSRTSLKVVRYAKGDEIIFSRTKDNQYDVVFSVFDSNFTVSFDRVVAKEV